MAWTTEHDQRLDGFVERVRAVMNSPVDAMDFEAAIDFAWTCAQRTMDSYSIQEAIALCRKLRSEGSI